jgi:hypothetical protein
MKFAQQISIWTQYKIQPNAVHYFEGFNVQTDWRIQHAVLVSLKTDVSEVFTASIIRAMMMETDRKG